MLCHASIIRSIITRNVSMLSLSLATRKLSLHPCPRRVYLSTSSCSAGIFSKMGDIQSGLPTTNDDKRPGKIKLTDEEWKAKLTAKEYRVTRKHGTEEAFTGELLENKEKGMYVCTCCGAELFSSSVKFDSGSGWPSFSDVEKDRDMPTLPAVNIVRDESAGMIRSEVKCGKCDAHLGHVFNDGPRPTGQRYCINSVCMKFNPQKK